MPSLKKNVKDVVDNIEHTVSGIFGLEQDQASRAVWNRDVTLIATPTVKVSSGKISEESRITVGVIRQSTQNISESKMIKPE